MCGDGQTAKNDFLKAIKQWMNNFPDNKHKPSIFTDDNTYSEESLLTELLSMLPFGTKVTNARGEEVSLDIDLSSMLESLQRLL